MREFTIEDIFNIFMDNIKVIVLTMILFGVLSITYTKIILTPMFESSTKIILVKQGAENNTSSSEVTSDIMLNQKLVSTYSEIITSRKVVEKAVKEVGIDIKYENISKNIVVTPVKDSEVMNISVKYENPNIAAAMANTLVKVFAEEVKDIYNISNVKQVDKAIPTEHPYNVSLIKNGIIFVVIGFVLSYGIAFLCEYLKTTVSSVDELEEILEVAVIGIVPQVIERKN